MPTLSGVTSTLPTLPCTLLHGTSDKRASLARRRSSSIRLTIIIQAAKPLTRPLSLIFLNRGLLGPHLDPQLLTLPVYPTLPRIAGDHLKREKAIFRLLSRPPPLLLHPLGAAMTKPLTASLQLAPAKRRRYRPRAAAVLAPLETVQNVLVWGGRTLPPLPSKGIPGSNPSRWAQVGSSHVQCY